MLDRSRQRRERQGHLSPGDTSAEHYWLMRRDDLAVVPAPWPPHLQRTVFNRENARQVHALLALTEPDIGDFASWLHSLECDAEYDKELWVIVADHEGIIGVIQCWTSAFIRHLTIHPRARRQGLGRLLLEQAFALFARRGEGWLDLKVMENNLPARRLYEQAGMHYVYRAALRQN